MDIVFSLFTATFIGFSHAFEADHLIAVSSIVTKRNNILSAAKDGIYWGLGHSSTIFLIGILMIVGRIAIAEQTFSYLEGLVGVMLVLLGVYRLYNFYKNQQWKKEHAAFHAHGAPHDHKLAYGVGAVHGLAGSGTLVLALMASMNDYFNSMAYLFLFGLGSIIGMLVASGLFSLPFSKKISANKTLQTSLTCISALLCIGFGLRVMYEHFL